MFWPKKQLGENMSEYQMAFNDGRGEVQKHNIKYLQLFNDLLASDLDADFWLGEVVVPPAGADVQGYIDGIAYEIAQIL
jgi:hypothetical protein